MTSQANNRVRLLAPGDPEPPPNSVVAALVNNMPDGAFVHSETQLLRLLSAGFAGKTIHVKRYTLAPSGRAPEIDAHLGECYFSVEELWESPTSLLVVTGSEPRAASLSEESYWPALTGLFDWGVVNCRAVLLSCLAAHAALLHLEGIQRRFLGDKCSGVYEHDVLQGHPLTVGLPAKVALPHSRFNGVETDALRAAGYEVLLDADVGWGVAARRRGGCDLLLFQGHPEYDSDSLLREYRRDLLRYMDGELDVAPSLPGGYLGSSDVASIERFRRDAGSRHGGHDGAEFPFDAIAGGLQADWAQPAMRLTANWLQEAARPPVGAGS